MKILRSLLVVAGLASVGCLVVAVGIETLLAPIEMLSWRIAVLAVVPYAVVELLRTLAWRVAFTQTRPPFGRLFWVRLAGETLNLGAVSVGGEPVKAYLIMPAVPLVEASAAVVIDKTSITVGQVLFLALGLVVALPLFDLPPDFRRAMSALLVIQIIVVTAFVLVQLVGMFRWSLRLLARCGFRGVESRARGLLSLDRAVAALYRERPGRVLACIVVHLLSWVVSSLEVYLVLQWLQVRASFADALVIDAFGTGVKFMAFAIPGALGALEGGYMVAFSALGLGSGLGLSFTLIRRLRMIVWGALGLLVLAVLRPPSRASLESGLTGTEGSPGKGGPLSGAPVSR